MKWVTPKLTIMVKGLPHSPAQGAVLVTNAQADHFVAMGMVDEDEVTEAEIDDPLDRVDTTEAAPIVADDHPAVVAKIAEVEGRFGEAVTAMREEGEKALKRERAEQKREAEKALKDQRAEHEAAFDQRVADAVKAATEEQAG